MPIIVGASLPSFARRRVGAGPRREWAKLRTWLAPRSYSSSRRRCRSRVSSTLRTGTPSVNDQAWYPPDIGEPGANHKHVGRTQAHDIGRYELGRSRRSEAMMAVLSGAAFSRACASVIQPRGSPRRGVTHARRTSTTDRTMITAATSSSTTIVNHKSRELANTPHSSFPGSGERATSRCYRAFDPLGQGLRRRGGHGPGRRAELGRGALAGVERFPRKAGLGRWTSADMLSIFTGLPDRSATFGAASPPFINTRYSGLITVVDRPADSVPGLAAGDMQVHRVDRDTRSSQTEQLSGRVRRAGLSYPASGEITR